MCCPAFSKSVPMEVLDNKLTDKIREWLSSDHSAPEAIERGADILLSLHNRYKFLCLQIKNNPSRPIWREKLEYELQKHLRIRADGMTRSMVARMDSRVIREAEGILSEATETDDSVNLRGRRADHDKLPAAIQNLFDGNASRYKKIRKLHTTLKSMGSAPSCDRYEYLKQLDELDEQYRTNMQQYDEYKLTALSHSEEDAATIAADRTWVSRNKPKLQRLYDARNDSELSMQEYEDFLSAFNTRVSAILSKGGTLGDKLKQQLEPFGVSFTLS